MGCCRSKTDQEKLVAAPQPSAQTVEKRVSQAKTTRVLALRECGLSKLPPRAVAADVGANLRTVDLSVNSLKALPEDLGAWACLQNLTCSQNKLTALPPTLGQLAGLQKLVLSGNKIQEIGPGLAQLGALKTLQLDSNALGPRLPAETFDGVIAGALEELDLSGNVLEELPASTVKLTALTRLCVARNRLRGFPPGIGNLTNLQYMDAAENRLTTIPSELLTGTSLSELWLKGCAIDRLELQKLPGFDAFLARRKQRIDARIGSQVVGAVDLAVCGLD
mmetsp:Transcript_100890/g.300962  ORF Transcript_100890/g.300962 Transcript_100890/m.300962 type:complete len:278 (-) Transcript_100890:62-895(-)